MFFRKRGGAGQERSREEKKRTKVIRFLDQIFKSHDLLNLLAEYLKNHARQLPPEVRAAIKQALAITETPLKPKLPFQAPREYTFQDIDDVIFERIKDIVSHASPDERFPQGFSNHLLDPNDPEKGMLDAKIRGLQYNSVVNLISRIRKELNANFSGEQKDVLNDEPNFEAVLAIKGLMNTLTKAEEENVKIVGLSKHMEVNRFITACFREPENIFKTHDYKSLDHQYYAFVVGNAKFLLKQEFMYSFDPSKVQQNG